MSTQTRVILLEAGPLLLLAALYLAVSIALVPQLWRQRRFSLLGLGVWMLFLFAGSLAGAIGAAKLDDREFLAGVSPWPIFALTLVAYVPAAIVLARWRERGLLVSAGRRVLEAEEHATERSRGAEAVSRLSTALTRTISGREAADYLFDELQSALGIDTALIAVVDEDEGSVSGYAARGVDESWWQEVTLDIEQDAGAIVNVVRERVPFAIYDVGTAPNVNRPLADRVGAKSAAFVPLISEGRVTGVVVAVTRDAPRLFSTSDLELIQDFANETALALGRLSSKQALEDALEREQVIAEISRRVRSELDLEAVVQVAVAEVSRAVGVSRGFIRLGEPGAEMPILSEWDAPGFDPVGEYAGRLPVSNLAARERRTVASGNVVTDPELDDPSLGGRETLLDLHTHAVLATPILVFDRMIGIFGLHRAEPTTWTEGEIALAEAVAREVGLAIHTARLLRENQRRLGEQTALLKAAQVLTSDLRFGAVIRRLVNEVVALLGADAADCWIFDGERRLLYCRAVVGVPERNVGRAVPPAGTFKRVIDSGRPALKRKFSTTEEPPPSEDYASFAEVLVAPITWLGEVRGVLGVCSLEHDRFDRSDLEVLDTFARLASLALHNAESFEERERQAQVQRGFYRIAEVLGSTLSLAETIDAFAQAASEALGGAAALVLEQRGERLVAIGSYELPEALEEGLVEGLPATAGPFAGSAEEERILAATSLADDDRFDEGLRALLGKVGYASLLCAPVAGPRGQTNPVVVLFDEQRAFSDNDLALARHLTGAARGALERAELFEAERRARAFSQRLAAIGGLLATKLDPRGALEEVVREAPLLLEADAAVARLLENDELVALAAWGPGTSAVPGTRSSSAAGVAGVVAQSRAPLAVEDAGETPRFRREDALLAAPMAGCLSVPMIAHGGRLYGVLSVYSERRRVWRDDEVQALVALAGTASGAVSSAELYRRVAEEKERSDAILANIADGIVAVDREGLIVLWNSMAEQITGVPAVEALGRRVPEVIQRELEGEENEPPHERQLAILRGGKEVWLSLTEAVMVDAAGAVAGRIFAFRDVSSERVVEQMKSDFVATVSHELRTPLTSIYGFAETLLRSDVEFTEGERGTFLGYIATESARLIGIVDDLLNVARLETGTLGLTIAPNDVAEVVEDVVARLGDYGEGHEVGIDVPRGEVMVQADREKLGQVLVNLLDNAIKFSSDGSRITVSARRRTDTGEIRVTDEGIGIPRSDQQRIFSKFYRAEGVAEAGMQGAGLGLFLARGLLAVMGGRIWVDSKEGRGSSFVFELPLATGEPLADELEPTTPEPARR